jgi:hypothetical protein
MASWTHSLRHFTRVAGALAAGLVVAIAVSGCADSTDSPGAPAPTEPGEPTGQPHSVALSEEAGWPSSAPFSEPMDDRGFPIEPVGWVDSDGETFWIVTWGSSSCPFIATALESIDAQSVAVRFEQAPAEVCTEDLAPRAHRFARPTDASELTVAEVETVANAFGAAAPASWRIPLTRD